MSSTFVSNSLLTVSTSRVRSIPLINRSLESSGSCASLILNGRFVKPVTLSNVFLLGYSRSSLQSALPEIPDAPKTSACFCAFIGKIKTLTAVAGGYIFKERNCCAVSILKNWMSRNTCEKSCRQKWRISGGHPANGDPEPRDPISVQITRSPRPLSATCYVGKVSSQPNWPIPLSGPMPVTQPPMSGTIPSLVIRQKLFHSYRRCPAPFSTPNTFQVGRFISLEKDATDPAGVSGWREWKYIKLERGRLGPHIVSRWVWEFWLIDIWNM